MLPPDCVLWDWLWPLRQRAAKSTKRHSRKPKAAAYALKFKPAIYQKPVDWYRARSRVLKILEHEFGIRRPGTVPRWVTPGNIKKLGGGRQEAAAGRLGAKVPTQEIGEF